MLPFCCPFSQREVIPGKPDDYSIKNPVFIGKMQSADQLEDDIRSIMDKPHHGSVCVLCRSNSAVSRVVEQLRNAGLTCHAKMEGGFYSTAPVNDLFAFLGALLYPDDPVRLFNFLLSSYAGPSNLSATALSKRAGSREKMMDYLIAQVNEDEWEEWERAVQNKPAFEFLRDYMAVHDPVEGYFRNVVQQEKGSAEDTRYQLEFYRQNLNKLFQILYDYFAGDFATLDAIYDFLNIRRTTGDTSEDAVYPEKETSDAVLAMTVHKAKGLEFDHVFLPSTGASFAHQSEKGCADVLLEGVSCPVKVGWEYIRPGRKDVTYKNDFYDEMLAAENAASVREETRILYVALTRAIQSLHVYLPQKPKPSGVFESWAQLVDTDLIQ